MRGPEGLLLLASLPAVRVLSDDCTLRPSAGGDAGQSRGCYCPAASRGTAAVVEFGAEGRSSRGPTPSFTVLAGAENEGLSQPRGLAFHPQRPCQLWAVNGGSNSVTVLFNPGTRGQSAEWRQDTCACHFMSRPTAIAFGGANSGSDNQQGVNFQVDSELPGSALGSFMTIGDDDNSFDGAAAQRGPHGGAIGGKRTANDFMGPTLWSADLEHFAVTNNRMPEDFPANVLQKPEGSHLDMIHQQPFGMGAAWSGDGVKYWSWDGGPDSRWGSVTLTDFGPTDHGYGGYNHDDGGVRRYDIYLKRVPGILGAMLVFSGWVYVADTGNARVIRFKADSGTDSGPVKPAQYWREPYQLGYHQWVGTSWQVIADESDFPGPAPLPSGLAISADGQRLFVSDAASQVVIAFAVTAPPRTPQPPTGEVDADHLTKIGTIETPATQIQGLAYHAGSERLFYTDAKANRIVVVNPDCPGSGHTTDSSGTCVCPDASAQSCSAPMDPLDPTKTIYSSFGKGKNFDGCARQYYDKCPGGDPTVPGHFSLAPCYNLGLEACEPETGVCRCGMGKEADCTDTADSGTCTCLRLGSRRRRQLRLPLGHGRFDFIFLCRLRGFGRGRLLERRHGRCFRAGFASTVLGPSLTSARRVVPPVLGTTCTAEGSSWLVMSAEPVHPSRSR